MRSSRKIFAAMALALVMSAGLSADQGQMGGPSRGTCLFIEGLMMKGMPVWVGGMLLEMAGCVAE